MSTIPMQMSGGYNWNQPTMNQVYPAGNMFQNGQMQQMAQMQQVNPQISYVPGRTVVAPDEVKPYEVPMNAPFSAFLRNDMNEIYVKYWNENGVIDTKIYRLVENDPADAQNESNDSISAGAFENMQKQLNRIEKMLKQRKPKTPYRPNNQQKEDESK